MSGPWEQYSDSETPPADGPWTAYAAQPEPVPPKGIEVPEHVPQAMEDRLVGGSEARQREGGLLQTIPAGAEMISTPEGRTRLWEAIKKYPSKFVDDMIDMAKVPGDVESGKIDLSTDDGIDKAIGLGMLVAGSRLNKLSATGKTSGLAVAMGENVSRISKGPMGEIYDLPIGTAARSEDFAAAAEVVAGEKAPMAVQEKLLAAYQEVGLHPSEVAHDAQTNPVLAQHLLSDEGSSLADLGESAWWKFNESDIELPKKKEAFRQEMSKLGFESNVADHFYSDITEKNVKIAEKSGIGKAGPDDGVPTLADDLHEAIKEFKVEPTSLDPKEQLPPRDESLESAKEELEGKVSVGETTPKEPLTWKRFYRQAIDSLYPLKGVDEDAYKTARLTAGQYGKAEHFIEHGTFDFNTYKTNGKGLAEIIKPMQEDMSGLRTYMVAKRSMEIQDSGKVSGIDYRAARQVAAAGEQKYAKVASDLIDYQNRVLKYMKDSGVMSGETFDAMVEANKNYVPFYRVMGENGEAGKGGKSFGPGSPIKKLKGSERDIVDPLESIVKNTYAYVSVAERNAVGIKIIDALKKEGAEVLPEKVSTKEAELTAYLREQGVTNPEALTDFIKNAVPEQDSTSISAWRDGKRESVRVNDPELVAAFSGMDQASANMLTRVLSVPSKTLRAGATLSPDFIVRNVIRDFFTAFVNTGKGIFSPIDTAKGLVGVIRKDGDFLDWLKGGGANATMVALDRRYLQESLSKLNVETGLMERGWNVVNPIRGLRMMSELMENATRLGEFKRLTGEGKEAIQAAAFGSREVTLDFAKIGASMRAYNMTTAFANAQIQGLDRIGRAFIDRPVNTMAKIAGGITLPSVLLWWANHDDQRYKDLPAYQKDLFWIVLTKDHVFRIPKPFELGVVFGSGVERILDATIGKDPEAFDNFSKSVMQVLVPNFIPTIAQPLAEQWANRSSFSDRTLIPDDQEKHLPEYQATPYTTQLSQALGKIISAFPGVRDTAMNQGPGAPFGPIARAVTSPILMENYISAWTGGLGKYTLELADAGLRKVGVLPDPVKPTDTLADIPVVKAFVIRYPSAGAQPIQDFHDKYDASKKYYDTWMAKAREGDEEAMQRIQAAGGPAMFVRLDAIKETLSEHSKLIRDIYKNPEMKADEKRQLIDSLYFNMIEISKAGKEMQTSAGTAPAP